ncbi:MAG TPA: hypothetical protein VNW04_13585 [Puia sp.]|jgi:hypothetical protein|nr:hypothetical protein [Puia sp.]
MNTIAKKSVNAGKFLTNEHVATLLSTYKQNRWIDNSEKLGKEDSLTAHVSIEELETLIERIKLQGGDGVRLHFAAYPDDYTPAPELAGRQTVVMVGTRKSEDGANKEIYLSEEKEARILAYGDMPVCPPFCGSGFGKTKTTTLVDRGDKGMVVA